MYVMRQIYAHQRDLSGALGLLQRLAQKTESLLSETLNHGSMFTILKTLGVGIPDYVNISLTSVNQVYLQFSG